ncbi:cytochrome P450 [Cyathus striatus]|nr:cytochrome P450 [Cyathus striatus]
MQLSPGLSFLAKILPLYFITSASTHFFSDAIRVRYIYNLPSWAIILFSAISQPLFIMARGYYSDYSDRRKAVALGAVMIPTVEEKWPVTINTAKILVNNLKDGYPGEFMWGWMKKYGNTFKVFLPFERLVWTSEPGHIKAILATQFDSFEKGPSFIELASSMLGTGVFNSDGVFHRAITRPFFIRERISDFEIFGVHADEALRQAKVRLAEGYPIDFQDLVSRFTLDSASEFLLGQNVESLSGGLAYPKNSSKLIPPSFDSHPSNRFVTAFMQAQTQLSFRLSQGGTWPLQELFSDHIAPNRKVLDEFVTPLMEMAIRKKSQLKDDLEERETDNLLDHLVQQTEDPRVLMDEVVNLLAAGRDTTASLLTYAVYMMAEHPDMTQRLRDEIISKVGPTNQPTYENIREMKFLRAFLNEVLRLYPPVPFNERISNKDAIFPSSVPGSRPLYVPALSRCVYSVFVMHRRTDLWGPDSMEFDPDRFIDERLSKYLTPNPFIFCPFNAGPRICLGQQVSSILVKSNFIKGLILSYPAIAEVFVVQFG